MRSAGLLVATLLAGASPAAAPSRPPGPRFSHRAHLNMQEQQSDPAARHGMKLLVTRIDLSGCVPCHELPAEGFPSALKKDTCAICHEQVLDPQQPPPRGPREPSWLLVRFAHERHAQNPRIACTECHVLAAAPVPRGERELFATPDCMGCHEQHGVPTAPCERCHRQDPRRDRPPDHDLAWPARHGQLVEVGRERGHGRDCRTCHGEDACRRCHRTSSPRDHTGLWRVRLHASAASWDRERCRTCHESGTCKGCHLTTPPPNHRGPWASVHGLVATSRSDDGCRACHQSAWCASCHAGR